MGALFKKLKVSLFFCAFFFAFALFYSYFALFLALNCPFLENSIAVIMFYNRPFQLQLISVFINLKEKSSTDKMGDYPKI